VEFLPSGAVVPSSKYLLVDLFYAGKFGVSSFISIAGFFMIPLVAIELFMVTKFEMC
jgi:hypothetical protein